MNVFLGEGQKEFWGRAGGDSFGDLGSYLAQHGIGPTDGNGSNNAVCSHNGPANGVFTTGALIGPCLKHLGRGNGIGSQGYQLDVLAELLSEVFNQGYPYTAALAVDNTDSFTSHFKTPSQAQFSDFAVRLRRDKLCWIKLANPRN